MKKVFVLGLQAIALLVVALIITTAIVKLFDSAKSAPDTSAGKKRTIEQAQIRYEADIQQAKSRYWDSVASLRGDHGLSNNQIDFALKGYYSTFKSDLRHASHRRFKTLHPLSKPILR